MKKSIITALALAVAVTFSGCAVNPNGQEEELITTPEEITGAEQTPEAEQNPESDDETAGQNGEDGEDENSLPQQQTGEDERESVEQEDEEEQADGGEQEEVAVIAYAKYIKVTGTGVNIRTGAGTNYTSLGSAEQNTLYACTGQSGGWYKTLYQNKTAYISAKYCEVVEMEQSGDDLVEKVIAEGLNLMGVKYVYGAVRYHDGTGKLNGGFTNTAFDCSSLTQYIFYLGAGALLQVNTRTQIYQGEHVDKSDLQRGDLMFFTNDSRYYNSGIERVGHVAVYLGDNYILHTSSDYAKIEQLTAKRWNYFLEARRML